jgi:hypothetical protein
MSEVPLDTLAAEIKARIEAGDRAADKAADHFRAAGIRLIDAKAAVANAGIKFDAWLAENSIGRSRAYELIAIAKGTKTLAGIRAATAERVAKHSRNRAAESVTNGLGNYKKFSETIRVALNVWAAAPEEWRETFRTARDIPADVQAALAEVLEMQWESDGTGFGTPEHETANDDNTPATTLAA